MPRVGPIPGGPLKTDSFLSPRIDAGDTKIKIKSAQINENIAKREMPFFNFPFCASRLVMASQ